MGSSLLACVCRVLLGVVFLFSGTAKAIDPVGGAIKMEEYFNAFGFAHLEWLAMPFAINLAAIEFTLGTCMLLGVYRRYASFLTLLMMCFMTPLTLYLALYNPVADCGCFGEALVLTNWETFYKNIVLLAAAFVAFRFNQRVQAGYSYKVYWFVALYAYMFCVGFSLRNYWHLPIVDFRPYKVGVNIPEQMTIPEGAPQDEYEYRFIYEKEGKRQTFTLDNVPAEDSTWTFIRTETKLLKQGYVPPITDFLLLTPEGEDLTESILGDTAGVFLLIAPKLETAHEERIDEINNIYDYAQEQGMRFYGVTSSESEAIDRWIDYTGAEYPFLFGDETMLKTFIRSNPGLVLLKGGTILAKWHYNDLPAEEAWPQTFAEVWQGKENDKKEARYITNLLTFAVPLLLVWAYDYRTNRRRKNKSTYEQDNNT